MFAVPGRVPGIGIGFDLAVKPAGGHIQNIVTYPTDGAEQQPGAKSHLQHPYDGVPAFTGYRVHDLNAGCDHYQEYEYCGGPAEDVFLFFCNFYHSLSKIFYVK